MAVLVQEIMNRELFSMPPGAAARDALHTLTTLGLSGCPVLDDNGTPIGMVALSDLLALETKDTLSQHMSRPVVTVHESNTIEEAARLLGETGFHRLVVVDGDGHAVGMLSALDVVRGLIGMPAFRPAVFSHYDESLGLVWTNDTVLDLDRVEAAPDGPGILVLIHGGAAKPERMIWVESAQNVRKRLIDMLSRPTDNPLALQHWLEGGDLRFRAASQADPDVRKAIVRKVRARMAGHSLPKGN
jgi:predicted transcriptional regulator